MPRLSANAGVIGLTPTPIHPQGSMPCACSTTGPPGCVWPGRERPQISAAAAIAMRVYICHPFQMSAPFAPRVGRRRAKFIPGPSSSFSLLARRPQGNAELGGLLIQRSDAALELARNRRGLGLLACECLESTDVLFGPLPPLHRLLCHPCSPAINHADTPVVALATAPLRPILRFGFRSRRIPRRGRTSVSSSRAGADAPVKLLFRRAPPFRRRD